MKSKLLILTLLTSFFYAHSQDKPVTKIGGTLYLQHIVASWKNEQVSRNGDFGYGFLCLKAQSAYKGISFNADYRWFSADNGGGMLKHGWIGYKLDNENSLQLGLTNVPFGSLPYTSSGWFLNVNYFLGLEDDYDMGIKWLYKTDRWEHQLAFFKNAEELMFGNNSEVSPVRYSYDVAGDNKEMNQVNFRMQYSLDKAKNHKIGLSGQNGVLYNIPTNKMGNHKAAAIHYNGNIKGINIKLQATTVAHNPVDNSKTIEYAAYNYPYKLASNFNTYTVGVSKKITLKKGLINTLNFYNDFGYMDKKENSFTDSMQNTTGCEIIAGNFISYIDFAQGYNHSWLGGNFVDDFAEGNPNAKWEYRFNIAIGYMF